MSLFRENIQTLTSITNIIYNNKFNIKCTGIKVPNTKISTINRIDFSNLQCNKSVNDRLEYYDDLIEQYGPLFKNMSSNLQFHFKNKVVFENGFDIMNITKMVRSFDISGKDIYLALTENNEQYKKYWDEHSDNNFNKYFDYVGSYGLKCSLPSDNNHYNIDTIINVRRYVDRSGTRGIKRVLELLEDKIKTPEKSYEEPAIIEPNIYAEPNDNIIIPEKLPKLQQYYYNNNHENIYPIENDKEFSNYKEFYIKGVNDEVFNLSKYFKYTKKINYDNHKYVPTIDDYTLTPLINVSLENLSVSACIMFGKDNIRYCDVEKLMSCIRFKTQMYSYTIDNFTIIVYDEHVLELCVDSETLNNIKFAKYDNFVETCKWLIQIMNNMDPKNINHHNYGILAEYCKKHDRYEEQMVQQLVHSEEKRIKDCTFENN